MSVEHIQKCYDRLARVAFGPWHNEPHYFSGNYQGYPYVIIRDENGLHLAGFIGLHASHPFWGRDYKELPIKAYEALYYSDSKLPNNEIPTAIWWVGFHCGHRTDFCPGADGQYNGLKPYRDFFFVEKECKSIISQLKRAAKK